MVLKFCAGTSFSVLYHVPDADWLSVALCNSKHVSQSTEREISKMQSV